MGGQRKEERQQSRRDIRGGVWAMSGNEFKEFWELLQHLFPFDFKEFDGEYWVIYYDQVCNSIPTDVDEIKMCAHSMRPLLELTEPYLSECSNPVFSKRLISQHYIKLFPISKIRDDQIDI